MVFDPVQKFVLEDMIRFIVFGGLGIFTQVNRIVIIVAVDGSRIPAIGYVAHRRHVQEWNLVILRIVSKLPGVHEFFAGDHNLPGCLGLLHIGKGDVRVYGRYQQHLAGIAPVAERIVHDDQFVVGQSGV